MKRTFSADRVAEMLQQARYESGRSQDQVARDLCVSKKTVQNWEAGISAPSLEKVIEYFDAIDVPVYPYIMRHLHQTELEHISAASSDEEIRRAVNLYVAEMGAPRVRELLYLFYGDHGSSPAGILDVATAYLHLPLNYRVHIAEMIVTAFEIASSTDDLIGTEHIMPDIKTIRRCAAAAKDAAMRGRSSYIFIEEGER